MGSPKSSESIRISRRYLTRTSPSAAKKGEMTSRVRGNLIFRQSSTGTWPTTSRTCLCAPTSRRVPRISRSVVPTTHRLIRILSSRQFSKIAPKSTGMAKKKQITKENSCKAEKKQQGAQNRRMESGSLPIIYCYNPSTRK